MSGRPAPLAGAAEGIAAAKDDTTATVAGGTEIEPLNYILNGPIYCIDATSVFDLFNFGQVVSS